MNGSDAKQPRRRTRSSFRAFTIGILGLVILVAGAVLFLRTQFAWERACRLARRELPFLLKADVRIGRCEIDPLSATAALYDVAILPRDPQTPAFSADAVQVRVRAFRPVWGSTDLAFLRVRRPRLQMDLSRPSSGAPAAPSGRCALDALHRLRIRDLEISDGEAIVQFDAVKKVSLEGLEIRWAEKGGPAEFEVRAGGGQVKLQPDGQFALANLNLKGTFGTRNLRVDVSGGADLDDARVNISGNVADLCHPSFGLRAEISFPMQALRKSVGFKGRLQGDVKVLAMLSGRSESPIVSMDVTGHEVALGQFNPGSFSGILKYSDRQVSVKDLVLAFGPGSAMVNGTLKLTKELPAQFRVDVRGAQFARILENVGLHGPWVDFAATGKVNISGQFLPVPRLTGEGDIQASKFLLATRPFDAPPKAGINVLTFGQGHVTLGVRILNDRVDMHHIKGEVGQSRFTGNVTLFYDPARGIAADAFADPLDLSELGSVAQVKFTGRGTARTEIAGPFSDVRVRSTLDLRDFGFWTFFLGNVQTQLNVDGDVMSFPTVTGQLDHTQYHGSGALHFGGGLRASWNLAIPKGRSEDLLGAIAGLSDAFDWAQEHIQGDATGTLHIDSPVNKLEGGVQLELANTEYDGHRLGKGKISVRFVNGESLVLDPSSLEGPVGKLSAKGTLHFQGPVAFHLRGDGLSLAELVGAESASKLGISGTLTAVGEVTGDSDSPVYSAYLTSPQVTLAGKRLGETHLEGRIRGRELQIFGRPFNDAQVSALITIKSPFPYTAKLTMSLPEIRPLLPEAAIVQGWSGALAGTVDLKGELSDRDKITATAKLDKLRLLRGDFAGQNQNPVRLEYSGGRLDISQFTFTGPNTELTLAGGLGPKTLDLRLSGNMDLRLIEWFIPRLEQTGGQIDVTATATGSLKEPGLVGTAEIRNARASVRDQPITARGVSGRIDFSEARILLQDFHGVLNEGRASLRGNIKLEHFALKSLEIGLQLDETNFRLSDDLPFTISGELSLFGKPEALVLGGDLDIVKFRYERPLVLEKLLTEIKKTKVAPGSTSAEKPKEWLTFDVGIHARGDVRIDNNLARAKLRGDLKLTGNNVRPGLLGSIQTAEGSQAFYRGNQFAIRQGLLEFKDRNSVDAVFDIHADTQVREYLIRLHAFGRTSSPQAVLTSEPQLSEGDILSLLTLGIISRDKSNTAGAGAGLAAEAFFNASGLDQQVQRFLPNNPLLRDLSFHIATVYNDATGVVEPNAQLESKFLTEQLKLRLTQPVSGRGTKAQAEYQFDDRLSAQAQWDNEHIEYPVGNWGLNLKLHWEVE